MSAHALQLALEDIARLEGVRSCALLDMDTGMAWLQATGAGETGDFQPLCEAASDYWRLHRRHAGFYDSRMGGLSAQVVIHAKARLTLLACGERLLLVTVSAEPDHVPWAQWKPLVGTLVRQAALN